MHKFLKNKHFTPFKLVIIINAIVNHNLLVYAT